ncbi:PREDICTED: sorcin-like [Lupinus angustifolius]|uniref:sorcin-like n=1 Tax=Lupinus angustifolius TaxID=3871 RepID=UPI00092E37E0|nr:PREDICTED: sorcin-like [Lupinus angustifolius]
MGIENERMDEMKMEMEMENKNKARLRGWFERVDSDKTGSITALQLKRALAVGNLEFPLSVVQQMIRMYDFDRNGTMSFEEFLALNNFLLKLQHTFSDLERYYTFSSFYLLLQAPLRLIVQFHDRQ